MQFEPLTHHIQLTILKHMLKRPESRYSDLKPKNVEANLFMYHMKQLIRAGLVEKQAKTYVLTRQGNLYADRVTLSTMKVRVQPKVVAVLCVRRSDDKWLVMKRKHQPFNGYVGFPSGKLHYGETLQQAANRELLEKAGLTNVSVELKGNIVMRFTDGDDIVNHIIGYVFYAEVPNTIDVNVMSEHYETHFGLEQELFVEPYFKGHQQILDYLKRGQFPFIEESQYTSDY